MWPWVHGRVATSYLWREYKWVLWFLGVAIHSPPFYIWEVCSLNQIECDLYPMAYLKSSTVGDEPLHAARGGHIRSVLTAKNGSRNFDCHFYCLTAWPYCKMALDRLTVLEISWWPLTTCTFCPLTNNIWKTAKRPHLFLSIRGQDAQS